MPSQSKLLGDLISAAGTVTVNGSSLLANTIANSAFQTGSVENYFNTQGLSIGRNRIINGDMRIDQRNAGASVTPTNGQYCIDRWVNYVSQASKYTVQQNAGSVTPPAGFTNYLGVTSTSSYSVLSGDFFIVQQRLEGFNVSDLDWGKSTAKTITISFWVQSSLTGTFGGVIKNAAGTYTFPFGYTISSANTWTQISFTVPGQTSGVWPTDNSFCFELSFSIGAGSSNLGTANAWVAVNYGGITGQTNLVGTNGATWYITGVQLEVGSTATPFERRLFNQELTNCQRYYIQSYPYGTVAGTNIGSSGAGVVGGVNYGATSFGYTLMGPFSFPVTMRTNASVTIYNSVTGSTTASNCVRNLNASTNVAGYVVSVSDKQAFPSCDNAPVTTRAECAITATAEL